MKKFILFLMSLFLISCVNDSYHPTVLDMPIQDTRVPRYCFVKPDQTLSCYRNLFLCNEAEFEERFVNHFEVRRHCRYFRVERNLLPYWDQ